MIALVERSPSSQPYSSLTLTVEGTGRRQQMLTAVRTIDVTFATDRFRVPGVESERVATLGSDLAAFEKPLGVERSERVNGVLVYASDFENCSQKWAIRISTSS